jgi:hypothetical protein
MMKLIVIFCNFAKKPKNHAPEHHHIIFKYVRYFTSCDGM